MLFGNTVKKIPYIGNLVETSYLVYNKTLTNFSAIVRTNSVRLYEPLVLIEKEFDGMIVSNSELHEAHLRYIKYAECIPEEMAKMPLGKFTLDFPIKTKRPGGRPVKMNIIFLQSRGNDLTGYMFSKTDLEDICKRTDRIRDSIRRPKWYQRILLWFDRLK